MAPDAAFLQKERLGPQALEYLRALPNAARKRFYKPTELTRDQHCGPGESKSSMGPERGQKDSRNRSAFFAVEGWRH